MPPIEAFATKSPVIASLPTLGARLQDRVTSDYYHLPCCRIVTIPGRLTNRLEHVEVNC
jgi:hypothetical protein